MILFINTTADPRNASAKLVSALRGQLFSEGTESVLAYGRGYSTLTQDIKIGSTSDLLSHTAFSRLTGREGEASGIATYNLLRQLDKLDIKLVHIHNLHGHYLNVRMLTNWVKAKQLPVVLTLHDCWTFSPRCATFIHNNCEPSAAYCRHCRHKDEYPAALYFNPERNLAKKRQWFQGIDNITVAGVSNWITDLAKQHFPSYDARFITIGNGVDHTIFNPEDRNINGNSKNKKLIAAAANWEPSKGLEHIIELSSHLPAEYELTVIGNLMGKALPDSIKYGGRNLSPEQMAEAYRSADILLFPAKAETFGMVLAEALACGTPVIANQSPASREIITPTDGLLADFSSPESVVSAISSILEYPGKYNPESKDIKKTAEEYASLYRSILKKEV